MKTLHATVAQIGSSLIEVLVAMLVTAFALAGMIGMQARSLNFNLSSV
jgi:Tfp pilus assembly protein PilV